MAETRYVTYVRVSTTKQEGSGLGLAAQKKTIDNFLAGGGKTIEEFIEVESGKNDNREQLKKALHRCKISGAILVIAKLDRLSRDLNFISAVMKAGIDFIACDMPTANKFTIHIFAALAEQEREMISTRTREAMAAAKARGQVLGSPNNLTGEAAERGRKLGALACRNKADIFAQNLQLIINEMTGQSFGQIARELSARRILTAQGKTTWTGQAVKNLKARISKIERGGLGE